MVGGLADLSPWWWVVLGLAALILVARSLPQRRGAGPDRRADRLAGREAVVIGFDFHEGQVSIDGVAWSARLDGNVLTPAPGDRVRVTAADGRVVWVRPIAPDPLR